jgi:hypothetical protein
VDKSITNGNEFARIFKIHFQKGVNIYSLKVDVMNFMRMFIYLGHILVPVLCLALVLANVIDLRLFQQFYQFWTVPLYS